MIKIIMEPEFQFLKHYDSNSFGRSPPCWEPAREIPPMTRSCGRELLSKASGLEVFPRPAQASAPKPESLSYYFVPFTNSPDINRGLSPTTFLWRKST